MAEITIRQALNDGGIGVPDSHMNSFSPLVNYGTDQTNNVGAGNTKTTPVQRGIIIFPTGAIPAGSTINSAKLTLRAQTAAGSAEGCYVFRVTRYDWVEDEVCWNKYKASTNWTAGGGDYYGGDPYTSFNQPTATGDFDITGMKDLVIDAIENRANKLNLILRRSTEASPDSWFAFWSRDIVTGSWRPRLIVDYTPPAGNPEYYYRMQKRRRAY